MKKLFFLSLITLLIGSTSFASTIDTAKKAKAKVKEAKMKATDATAHLKKDGTPDKRYKDATEAAATKTTTAAKEVKTKATDAATTTAVKTTAAAKEVKTTATTAAAAAPAKVTTVTAPAKEKAAKAVTQGENTSADKAIGTDDKGRTIYLGPRGGKYTLTATGRKSYIKQN